MASLSKSDSEEESLKSLMHSNSSLKDQVVEVSPTGKFFRVRLTQFNEELGAGAYKRVYRGLNNDLGCEVAWNVISMKNIPKEERAKISEEIQLNRKLNHPNVIHFIAAWTNPYKAELVFITELVTGGSLKQYLRRIKQPRLKVIKLWCRGVLNGLVYLHSQQPYPIVHRDLKCDNLFVMANTGDIKIGDFGLSTLMRHSLATSVLGTPEFMAPEVYEGSYDERVDVYSFGMCVLEMVTLKTPYKECQTPAAIYHKIISRVLPAAIQAINDEELKEFILLCLQPGSTRPSAQELMNHPFLQIHDSDPRVHQPVPLCQQLSVVSSAVKDPVSPSNKRINISLIICDCTGENKEVSFEYSLNEDTPEEVSEEMVRELKLDQTLTIPLAKEIERRVNNDNASPVHQLIPDSPLNFSKKAPTDDFYITPFSIEVEPPRIQHMKTEGQLGQDSREYGQFTAAATHQLLRGALEPQGTTVSEFQQRHGLDGELTKEFLEVSIQEYERLMDSRIPSIH